MRLHPRVLLLATAIAFPSQAQAPNESQLADRVRVAIELSVDAGDIAGVVSSETFTDRALTAFPDAAILLHYKAYALYRAGTMTMGQGGAAKARPYFEKARVILERLVKRETIPETPALLSSVYGMQIATSRVPMLAGIQLGSKSTDLMARAVLAGPRNPRVWVLKGIGAFNTPASFGGGFDKAESDLRQALARFADDRPPKPLPAWGLADAHIWLGQVLQKRGMREAARAQYDSALALQPSNGWVKHSLIPALEKKP